MKHYDCSPFARPASFAQLAMAAYTPLLAIETIPSPFCSRADILPLTMGRFAPRAAAPLVAFWPACEARRGSVSVCLSGEIGSGKLRVQPVLFENSWLLPPNYLSVRV